MTVLSLRLLLVVVLYCFMVGGVEGWTVSSIRLSRIPATTSLSLVASSSGGAEGWTFSSTRINPLLAITSSSLQASSGNDNNKIDDVEALQSKAEQLRQEVASIQKEKQDALDTERRQIEQEQSEKLEARLRYSAEVPIFKEDGSTVVERVDFPPLFVSDESRIEAITAPLPLGMILGEYDGKDDENDDGNDDTASSIRFPMAMRVDAVAEGSNAEAAGVQAGDLLRACTATQTIMDVPTWQLLAGGVGMPKTKRVMYSVDGRPFEEVMDAIGSNRMDPEGRPVVLVLERPR